MITMNDYRNKMKCENFHCNSCESTDGHMDIMEESGDEYEIIVCDSCGWWI